MSIAESVSAKTGMFKVGVIGVGSLGQHHARVLSEIDGVESVFVCDERRARVEKIAARLSCDFVVDWRQLIGNVDAVTIATPTATHCKIACGLLAEGIHCLVEKPIALDLDEADRMIETAAKSGAQLMVGHLERYNPAMRALRPRVTNPVYFEIHRVSPFPNRSLDVDVVLDVMIHDLDAVRWLVGEEVEIDEIRAVGIPIVSDKVDAANARIEFRNGAVANITASRVGGEKIRKTRFYQTEAYVSLDYAARTASITSLNPEAAHPLGSVVVERLETDDREPLRVEIEEFLRSIDSGEPIPISGEDGRAALELALGVLDEIGRHRSRLMV